MNIKKLKKLCENYSLLYVEDDKDIAKVFLSYLKKLFNVIEYQENGKKGLVAYREREFDLVITDIQMPLMDGLEMASKIKNINQNQNILFVSAYSDNYKLLESIKIGVDGYILKPVDYDNLNSVLYKTLYKIKKMESADIYKNSLEKLVNKKTSENLFLKNEKIKNYEKTLYALIEIIESRDAYTGKHSLRVANYAKKIAKEVNLDDITCEEIFKAGMLHDLGKIGIPDSLLLKPNKLNEKEFNLIKQHVNIGFNMLNQIPMFKNISKIINEHHERLDGSGYPNGIKGDAITLGGAILGIADTFDAITTSRIYKRRKTVKEAITEIKSLTNIYFEKFVVDAAVNALKDEVIDNTINQLPHTKLEEERFSFFYKDSLCNLYNETYLNFILAKNMYEFKFSKIQMICLNNFGNYNKKYSWPKGNELLINISITLKYLYSDKMIFRIHGDDFIILCKDGNIDNSKNQKLEDIVKGSGITIEIKEFDITEKHIDSLVKLESLI